MEMKVKLDDNKANNNEEIDSLFENAISELKDVISESKDAQKEATGKKKKIVLELRESLKGKMKEEDISTEIKRRLKGYVSLSHINDCLGVQYKKDYRIKNAKLRERFHKELATVPLLNAEADEEDKENEQQGEEKKRLRQPMIVDVHGNITTQYNDDGSSIDSESIESNNSFESSISSPYKWYQQEEQQQQPPSRVENCDDEEMKEHSKSDESSLLDNHNLNGNEEREQIDGRENEEVAENRINTIANKDILNFEFSIQYDRVQRYMASLFRRSKNTHPVWFRGKIHIKTGRVVNPDVGGIDEDNEV